MLTQSYLLEFNRDLTRQWGKMYEADEVDVVWHGTYRSLPLIPATNVT